MDKMDIIFDSGEAPAHDELETMFRRGVLDFRKATDQMALSLYHMQKFGTWRIARNYEGELFPTWTAYSEWLCDDTGLARSTMFDYKSMVKFALVNGLADDSEQFVDRGGVLTFRRIKKRAVCNSSGEIIGLIGASSSEPGEVIKKVVEIIDPESRPMDQVKLIEEVIKGSTNVVEVFFRLRSNEHGGHDLVWIKESNVGHDEGLVQYGSPDEVMAELKSKFHILD